MDGENGIPVRVTISDMGPVLLSRLLGLTKVHEGVLNIVFRIADDRQMLLIGMKDLRSMLNYVSEHAKEYATTYGNVSSQSVDAILRALIAVEDQGGDVLAQLSNRVQHGLRAYTPAEQKAVKAAAEAFRANPNFKSEDAIMELGTGEALVSFLDADGKPSIVENAKVLPPQCLMAAASDEAKSAVIQGQVSLMAKYGDAIDRESAFEMIQDECEQNAAAEELARERAEFEAQKAEFAKQQEEAKKAAEKEAERQQKAAEREAERQAKAAERERQKQKDAVARVATSILGFAGRTAANQIVRGLFGTRR